ncbi:MAG: hypothetical protein LBB38_02230 [Puniceicoccales bacterium]|nr:hypothetical protein [Puniceicoccales bacterium]
MRQPFPPYTSRETHSIYHPGRGTVEKVTYCTVTPDPDIVPLPYVNCLTFGLIFTAFVAVVIVLVIVQFFIYILAAAAIAAAACGIAYFIIQHKKESHSNDQLPENANATGRVQVIDERPLRGAGRQPAPADGIDTTVSYPHAPNTKRPPHPVAPDGLFGDSAQD